MPTISIIVPVYNCAQFVESCLESIARQSFTDWECIVVDDGSTDSSGQICDEFASKDKRFSVIHQSNQGHPAARNLALDLVKGKYIGFVDSDDYIHPEMYRILFEQIEETGADFVLSKYLRANEQVISFPELPCKIESQSFNREQIFEYWFKLSEGVEMWTFWNKLYTREIIGSERIVNIIPGEDQDFNFRICLKCNKAIIVDAALYNWHIREGSITWHGGQLVTAQSRNINLLQLVEFIKYTSDMTEREKAAFFSRIMNNILACRNVSEKDPSIEASLKSVYKRTSSLYYKNKEVRMIEKLMMYLSYHFPILYKMYLSSDFLLAMRSMIVRTR